VVAHPPATTTHCLLPHAISRVTNTPPTPAPSHTRLCPDFYRFGSVVVEPGYGYFHLAITPHLALPACLSVHPTLRFRVPRRTPHHHRYRIRTIATAGRISRRCFSNTMQHLTLLSPVDRPRTFAGLGSGRGLLLFYHHTTVPLDNIWMPPVGGSGRLN